MKYDFDIEKAKDILKDCIVEMEMWSPEIAFTCEKSVVEFVPAQKYKLYFEIIDAIFKTLKTSKYIKYKNFWYIFVRDLSINLSKPVDLYSLIVDFKPQGYLKEKNFVGGRYFVLTINFPNNVDQEYIKNNLDTKYTDFVDRMFDFLRRK